MHAGTEECAQGKQYYHFVREREVRTALWCFDRVEKEKKEQIKLQEETYQLTALSTWTSAPTSPALHGAPVMSSNLDEGPQAAQAVPTTAKRNRVIFIIVKM